MKESRSILGNKADCMRFPKEEVKEKIINIVNVAKKIIPVDKCINATFISLSRLKSWKQKLLNCLLEDHSSCPKSTPSKATNKEQRIMEKMIKSEEYAHFPISNLAAYAIKKSILFLSPGIWLKYAKENSWMRSRKRLYKQKKEIGIRATHVNQIWHIDITVMKLVDNTKVFLQAVRDNFSRYIIAWDVFTKVTGENTKNLLLRAKKGINITPELYCDSGIENLNFEVQSILGRDNMKQTIAQIDVHYSNDGY